MPAGFGDIGAQKIDAVDDGGLSDHFGALDVLVGVGGRKFGAHANDEPRDENTQEHEHDERHHEGCSTGAMITVVTLNRWVRFHGF